MYAFILVESSILLYIVGPDIDSDNETIPSMIPIEDGESIYLVCESTAVPTPSIMWTFNGLPTDFNATVMSTEFQVMSNDTITITAGMTVSTLHLVNPRYPADHGNYSCTATSTHALMDVSLSFNIFIVGTYTANCKYFLQLIQT